MKKLTKIILFQKIYFKKIAIRKLKKNQIRKKKETKVKKATYFNYLKIRIFKIKNRMVIKIILIPKFNKIIILNKIYKTIKSKIVKMIMIMLKIM